MKRTKPTTTANRIGFASPLVERVAAILVTVVVVVSGLMLSPTVRESAAAFDRMQQQASVEQASQTPSRIEQVNHRVQDTRSDVRAPAVEVSKPSTRRAFIRQLVRHIWLRIEYGLQFMRNTVMA